MGLRRRFCKEIAQALSGLALIILLPLLVGKLINDLRCQPISIILKLHASSCSSSRVQKMPWQIVKIWIFSFLLGEIRLNARMFHVDGRTTTVLTGQAEDDTERNVSMRVNLNQLCVFYLAARHGSMTEAANALYVSTPAVTMQIKKLESWLGFPLFERGQGRLGLTERGRGLYGVLAPIFDHLGELERYIQEEIRTGEVEIRFGTHHLPGNYFIPDLITHVHARYPRLQVRIELGTQDVLLEKVLQQKLDLALIIGRLPEGKKYRLAHLFDEDLVLVTAAGNEPAKPSLSVDELGAIPLILQQKGTGARQAVLDFLGRHGVVPHILLENLSSDVIKQFLLTMPAAAFIGRFIVRKELDEGTLREIKIVEGAPMIQFYLAYMDSQHIPMKISDFLSGITGFSPSFPRSASAG